MTVSCQLTHKWSIKHLILVSLHRVLRPDALSPGPVGWDWGSYRANPPMVQPWVPTPGLLASGRGMIHFKIENSEMSCEVKRLEEKSKNKKKLLWMK